VTMHMLGWGVGCGTAFGLGWEMVVGEGSGELVGLSKAVVSCALTGERKGELVMRDEVEIAAYYHSCNDRCVLSYNDDEDGDDEDDAGNRRH
jgi:hypothetical protein